MRRRYKSRQDNWERQVGGGSAQTFYLAKPDQNVSAGALSAPNNVFSVWKGPAWGGEDADTGKDIAADYALDEFTTSDYVLLTRISGKWYVSCFTSGA